MNSKEELVEYLLSEEYVDLLELAILARLGTTRYNEEQHTKAFELLSVFRSEHNI